MSRAIPEPELPLVARFQRARWGRVRKLIDSLSVGQSTIEPRKSRNAIITAIRRTRSAYGRTFSTRGGNQHAKGPITVTRNA